MKKTSEKTVKTDLISYKSLIINVLNDLKSKKITDCYEDDMIVQYIQIINDIDCVVNDIDCQFAARKSNKIISYDDYFSK